MTLPTDDHYLDVRSEAEAIKEFFDEFGFVVVRNAVTGDEADAVLDDMFDVLESNSGPQPLSRRLGWSVVQCAWPIDRCLS